MTYKIEFYPARETNPEAVFSILIPTWNNLPYLQLCINSIIKNSEFKHQIIVHVNEGNDGTREWIKTQPYDYTDSIENVGVCHSLNAMAKLVKTDYVLFLNDDMYVCPGWDKAIYTAIKNHPDNKFFFSGTMIEWRSTTNKSVLSPYNFGDCIEKFNEEKLLEFVKTAKHTDWFGSSWPPSIVHKEMWDKVNGYSVEFSPGMYSDPDFSMKLWQEGVREFRGIGSSFVYHFMCRSTGRLVKNNGRKTFASKWGITASYFYKKVLKMGQTYQTDKELRMNYDIHWMMAKVKALWISIR